MSEGFVIQNALSLTDKRELNDAVFTLSSAKPGNGVEQLRDNNLDTYWQSDGQAPHIINIQFMKKVSVSQICLYCDYTLDESYTVKKVCIRSGTTIHDVVDITTIELNDPKGWVIIDLTDSTQGNSSVDSSALPLRTHLLQVRIQSMHQNGRDTHIRQIKVLGPRETPVVMGDVRLDAFKTNEMSQFSLLR